MGICVQESTLLFSMAQHVVPSTPQSPSNRPARGRNAQVGLQTAQPVPPGQRPKVR